VSDLTGKLTGKLTDKLGKVAAVGLGAVAILAVTAAQAAAPSSSGAARGITTVTETTSSPAGSMTVKLRYRPLPHGKLKLLWLGFSGAANKYIKNPQINIEFRPPRPSRQEPGIDIVIFAFGPARHFAGSLGTKHLDVVPVGETITTTLERPVHNQSLPVIQDEFILTQS
jgi:hypothetical protein